LRSLPFEPGQAYAIHLRDSAGEMTYILTIERVVAMRLANRTSSAQGRVCSPAVDTVTIPTDRAAVSLSGRAGKRAFDIVVATAGLVLFSPIFLFVAIAIKIDSRGPVFRAQTLNSYNDENIPLLEFRTTIDSLTAKSTSIVTRVGGVLRRSGVDCLPRLINVLRGEMSIVGPAPYAALPNNIFAEQVSLVQQRHRVNPGITGWAQVNGCCGDSNMAVRRRIEFDRYYIENCSFLFDIKVILMTLFSKKSYLD